VLEGMKLDVANHQIHHMGAYLVQDTINFQTRYNLHRIANRKVDVEKAQDWLREEQACPMVGGDTLPNELLALGIGVLKSLMFYEDGQGYPPTFYLDVERLRNLRQDIHVEIFQKVSRDALIELSRKSKPSPTALLAAIKELDGKVAAMVGTQGNYHNMVDSIAAELMKLVLKLEPNSGPYDETLLQYCEELLSMDLHYEAPAFSKQATIIYERLLPKVLLSVEKHVELTPLQLQDKLLPPAAASTSHPGGFGAHMAPPRPEPSADPDDEVVRRFTHMVVLHWQVWKGICYLLPTEEEYAAAHPEEAQSPASSTSSTFPFSTAVYAPGMVGVPIGVNTVNVSRRASGSPRGAQSPSESEQNGASERSQR
jgi:hypothetical protein